MRWLTLIAILVPLGSGLGALQDGAGNRKPAARIGFPWFLVPQQAQSRATVVAPNALRIMQRDGLREARKEREYWDNLRAVEERRIRDRYRVETQLALQRALAVAASRQALTRNSDLPTAVDHSSGANEEPGDGNRARHGERKDTAEEEEENANSIEDHARNFADKLDRAVEELVPWRDVSADGRRTSGVVFFLLLLALFLVPSFAVALLLLGIMHLRSGHRLQAGIFGLAGGAVLLMVVAAVQEMRGANADPVYADTTRLREECMDSAVRLTGFVYAPTTGGLIMNNVSGAPADEYGCAIIVTERSAKRSGEKWQRLVYPVGLREAPNAIGLVRPIPAYAVSLDQAVAWRTDEERASSEWWWQRVLRSIREA